jgi:hypothetical protein
MNLTASVTLPNLSAEPSPDLNPNTGQPLATVFRGKSPVTGRSFKAVFVHPTPDDSDGRGRLTLDRIESPNARAIFGGIPFDVLRMTENARVDESRLQRELRSAVVWLMEPLGEHIVVKLD